jgi:hypothetical protein
MGLWAQAPGSNLACGRAALIYVGLLIMWVILPRLRARSTNEQTVTATRSPPRHESTERPALPRAFYRCGGVADAPPPQAGIQHAGTAWIPAYAGMTISLRARYLSAPECITHSKQGQAVVMVTAGD